MTTNLPVKILKTKGVEASKMKVKSAAQPKKKMVHGDHERRESEAQLIEVSPGVFDIVVICGCGERTVVRCESVGLSTTVQSEAKPVDVVTTELETKTEEVAPIPAGEELNVEKEGSEPEAGESPVEPISGKTVVKEQVKNDERIEGLPSEPALESLEVEDVKKAPVQES